MIAHLRGRVIEDSDDDTAASSGDDVESASEPPLPRDITLTERPDVAKLEGILVSPELTHAERAELAAYARVARSGGGEVPVTYVRKGPGRLYPVRAVEHPGNPLLLVPVGAVAVKQSRRVRSALFGDTHLDVDIVNCQPRLLLALLKGCSAIEPGEYAHLEEYIDSRESVIAREDLDKRLAKKLVSIVLFGGGIKAFFEETGFKGGLSPWWRRFVNEAKKLRKRAWKHALAASERKEIKAYLASDAYKQAHPGRVQPDGTVKVHDGVRLAVALQRREADAVLQAILELESRGVPVESYQYDGFLVRKEFDEKVEKWMVECNTDEVEFAIKKFDKPLAAPPFRRFDPAAFEVPVDIEIDDVEELQLLLQLRVERYLFKTITPAGFVFLPDGPASSHRAPRRIADVKALLTNVSVPVVKEKPGKDGSEMVVRMVPFFPWWLEQPSSRQYNDMEFRPPPLPLGDGHYTTWLGFKAAADGVDPEEAKGRIQVFIDHCTALMEGNAEWGGFLLDVLAHHVQRPGERTGLALVFLGSQGTGKTGFFEHFCRALLYEHNYLVTEKPEQITGKFHLLAEKILVLWEEAEGRDTHDAADRIKHLFTAEKEYTERKFVDAALHDMCFLPVIVANHLGRRAVRIEDSDRRFVVMKVGSEHVENDPEYFEKLFASMSDPAFMRDVFAFLRARDISKYKNSRDWSEARPVSDTYEEMKLACRDPVLGWFESVATALADDAVVGGGPHAAKLDDILRNGDEFSASDAYPAHREWLKDHGYKDPPELRDFQLELGKWAGDSAWLKKFKTPRGGLMRYKIDAEEMVASLVGEPSD